MTKNEIKEAVGEAIDEKLGSFFIEREQHYQDHMFISRVRSFQDKIQSHACNTVTAGVLVSTGSLLLFGVAYWVKSLFDQGK